LNGFLKRKRRSRKWGIEKGGGNGAKPPRVAIKHWTHLPRVNPVARRKPIGSLAAATRKSRQRATRTFPWGEKEKRGTALEVKLGPLKKAAKGRTRGERSRRGIQREGPPEYHTKGPTKMSGLQNGAP